MTNATGATYPEKWTVGIKKSCQVGFNRPLLSPRDCWTEEGVPEDLPSIKANMSELNKEVVDLVWGRPSGGGVSASIFRRWTQGLTVFFFILGSQYQVFMQDGKRIIFHLKLGCLFMMRYIQVLIQLLVF